MDPFIGLTERADILFHVLDEVINDSLLMVAGMEADRTEFADFCQSPIQTCDILHAHACNCLPTVKALPRSGPTP